MTFTVYTPTRRRIAGRNEIPAVLPPLVKLSEIVSKAAALEGGCGVYFLQRSSAEGATVVYVGQSVNVHARVAQHVAEDRKRFDCWSWVECHESQLDLLESLYIHWLRPAEQGRLTAQVGDELCAPISRRHLQHLLDGLAPASGWAKRRRAA